MKSSVTKRLRAIAGCALAAGVASLVVLALAPSARSEGSVQAGPASPVVASYKTGQVTQAELERVIEQRLPEQRKKIAGPGGREALLEELLRYDILAQEAERRGYATHPAVLQSVRRAAFERMLVEKTTLDPKDVDGADVEKAFQSRQRQFARPRMLRASQIQVATEAEARALRERLKQSDRDGFARVARERSSARTQRQGGELGYFDAEGRVDNGQPGDVPAPLVAAAFKLKLGQISQPIEHDGAFSLVMVTGELAALRPNRAAIDAQLREELAQVKREQAVEAFIAQLRAEAKPEVHPELLDQIQLPPMQPNDFPQGFAAAPADPRAPPRIVEPDGI